MELKEAILKIIDTEFEVTFVRMLNTGLCRLKISNPKNGNVVRCNVPDAEFGGDILIKVFSHAQVKLLSPLGDNGSLQDFTRLQFGKRRTKGDK